MLRKIRRKEREKCQFVTMMDQVGFSQVHCPCPYSVFTMSWVRKLVFVPSEMLCDPLFSPAGITTFIAWKKTIHQVEAINRSDDGTRTGFGRFLVQVVSFDEFLTKSSGDRDQRVNTCDVALKVGRANNEATREAYDNLHCSIYTDPGCHELAFFTFFFDLF